ncbi:hypothetical protein ACWEQ8_44250, partial [Streptomyces noursei]
MTAAVPSGVPGPEAEGAAVGHSRAVPPVVRLISENRFPGPQEAASDADPPCPRARRRAARPGRAVLDGDVKGYAAYKVADSVTSHEAWGLGSYCFYN